MFNIVVGIVWQLCLMALPLFIVIRHWSSTIVSAIVLACSYVLKVNWYDNLEEN